MRRFFRVLIGLIAVGMAAPEPGFCEDPARLEPLSGLGKPTGIIVRTTENVTGGGWVWLIKQCQALGIRRMDLLVKQDEDNFKSPRTGRTLQSGEMLVPLPGEKVAEGWEDPSWLKEMLPAAKAAGIEVWAWWPCFHDAQAAARYPAAAYTNTRSEHFVDPGFPEVRARQAELIAKLLEEYDFDGVSLDWVRFDGWSSGQGSPLAAQFSREVGEDWKDNPLKSDSIRARWYDARSRLLATWIKDLTRGMRQSHPAVRWGAFVLPHQFTDVSQNYTLLGASGLDYLQPMAYWADWKQTPEWVGDRVVSRHRDMRAGTAQWIAIGIDSPLEEIERALANLPADTIAGLSWFTYGAWEQSSFDKLRQLLTSDPTARRLFGYEAVPVQDPRLGPGSSPKRENKETRSAHAPALFDETCIWSLVCLAELYKRGALPPENGDPVVPILALHTFTDGPHGVQNYPYKCSTAFLDSLLKFLGDAGFSVCPLSRMQNYLMTGDAAMLPPKPIVLTLDDGSESVVKDFYPRLKKLNYPFTLALVTSWMENDPKNRHVTQERDRTDATMTWDEAREMYRSGLVEVVSHTDDMHYHAAETPWADEERPVLISRQFLRELGRAETNEEYSRRIRLDLITSRAKISWQDFSAPTILCWPYGEWNSAAREIAREVGFTHFLLFESPPVFATAESCRDGMPRLPVLRADEYTPMDFPTDSRQAQAWWLAFLKVGRDSQNIQLINATLKQLTAENLKRPEAELSLATVGFLRGDTSDALLRLFKLRQARPSDTATSGEIDDLLRRYNPVPE